MSIKMSFLLGNFTTIFKLDRQIFNRKLLHTTSAMMYAEPMRRKNKNIGNEMIRFREERKLNRINREIKRTKAKERILKPIEECQLDPAIEKDLENRRRPDVVLDFDEQERRALLLKEWSRYVNKQYKEEQKRIRTCLAEQEKALLQLKLESEFLYEEAVQLDENLVAKDEKNGAPKICFEGPKDTAPLDGYFAPDGCYAAADKNWNEDPVPLTEKQRYMLSDAYQIMLNRTLEKRAKK